MTFDDWLRAGWIVAFKPQPQDIAGLLRVVQRDLKDAGAAVLSEDRRLAIAYGAALQIASAALAASGYRAAREAHHFRTLQSLALTLGTEDRTIACIERFRKKRNFLDYEQAGVASEQEVREMIALAESLRRDLMKWLKTKHPELLRMGK